MDKLLILLARFHEFSNDSWLETLEFSRICLASLFNTHSVQTGGDVPLPITTG